MTFDTEEQMKDVAKSSLPNCFGSHAREIIPEFDYGMGRTDLVFINISESYWKHRSERLDISTSIPKKKYLISFLDLQGKDPVTEEYFYSLGAQREHTKRESLNWLMENNFVKKTSGDKIQTASNLRRHVTTTIAVELKLSKWKQALKQASRGRSFAEYKYVAIEEDNAQPALNNLDEFKSNNVGLISIDDDGQCNIYWTPERDDPYSELYRWKLNEQSVNKFTA